MNYALVGYGRMGREIERQCESRGHRLARIVDPAAEGERTCASLDADALTGADVAFEFTTPDRAEDNVLALLRCGVPVVSGTTGWKISEAVREAAESAGVAAVIAPNFSVGMNLFYRIVDAAAAALGGSGLYDPYVLETHHRGKLDTPSGTARRLAALLAARWPEAREPWFGNPEGALPDGSFHVVGLRAGHEPGRHVVGFDGPHDQIRVEHAARGRSAFALGAVLAAEWVPGRRGVHDFEPVLDDLLARGGAGGGPRGC